MKQPKAPKKTSRSNTRKARWKKRKALGYTTMIATTLVASGCSQEKSSDITKLSKKHDAAVEETKQQEEELEEAEEQVEYRKKQVEKEKEDVEEAKKKEKEAAEKLKEATEELGEDEEKEEKEEK